MSFERYSLQANGKIFGRIPIKVLAASSKEAIPTWMNKFREVAGCDKCPLGKRRECHPEANASMLPFDSKDEAVCLSRLKTQRDFVKYGHIPTNYLLPMRMDSIENSYAALPLAA